jgi:hypothetical protein
VSEPRPTFTCPCCRVTSPNPDDVRERYCFRCHWWTGVPELAAERPDLLALAELEGAALDAAIGRVRWSEVD